MVHLSNLLSSSIPSEAASAQQKSFVTYTLSSLGSGGHDPPSISLLESRSLVAAAGTTGLRTWEASLHLGEYLCAHASSLVQERSILELGAGTGYVSILCARHLRASHVIATDGSEDVVAGLADNFHLNGLRDTSIIQGRELKWGKTLVGGQHPEWYGNQKVDLVLGADVTYDEAGIAALTSTFDDIFDLYPDAKIIIAATRRNPKTFAFFQETCLGKGYKIEESDFAIKAAELQMGPFYPNKVPIRLCLITKS
jgi:predicted nicotinamide N-methyase